MVKRLSYYADKANRLIWNVFVAQYPDHVLVILPPDDTGPPSINTTEFGLRNIRARPIINDEYRVSLVRKRLDGHPFSSFVTVGRANNNDVVLRDMEVSKVHAYLESDSDGQSWTIRDGESKNGTWVNARPIPSDEKTPIRSSDTLRFGPGLAAVFFNPADFYRFLKSPEVVDSLLKV